MKTKRIEFFVTPRGGVMYQVDGNGVKEYAEGDMQLSRFMIELIGRQYPEALMALNQQYSASRLNKVHFDYLRVSRFVRCNFGNFDGLTYDVQDEVLHIEEVPCPLRCECPMFGIICKPKPFGLTERETEVARLVYSGLSHDDVAMKLNITTSTIKNTLQRIKGKLGMKSTRDVAKFFIAVL